VVVNVNFLRTRLARIVPAQMKPVWVLVLVPAVVASGTAAAMLEVLYHAAFAV
jgi:hypothetical protein